MMKPVEKPHTDLMWYGACKDMELRACAAELNVLQLRRVIRSVADVIENYAQPSPHHKDARQKIIDAVKKLRSYQ
jgi:hypothetical protein